MTSPTPAGAGPAPDEGRPIRPAHPHPPPHPDPHPVMVLRWPAEVDRRTSLIADQVPRLLVLDDAAPAPLVWDDLEDWVRSSAGRVEVEARIHRLGQRRPGARPALPVLDGDGALRGEGREVHLSTTEARLLHLLLDRRDEVVRRDALRAAGWPHKAVADRAVDGCISRLRRRIDPFAISIATVRGVGYLLERTCPMP